MICYNVTPCNTFLFEPVEPCHANAQCTLREHLLVLFPARMWCTLIGSVVFSSFLETHAKISAGSILKYQP